MSKEVSIAIIKGCGGCLAMVLIWRLVVTAIAAGIDGVMFFSGVAAIAGLGGYEVRWLVEAIKTKKSGG